MTYRDAAEEEFAARVDVVLEDIRDMLLSKRYAYGSDNLTDFGGFGILVRSSDKLRRLRNMYENENVTVDHESLADQWFDLAGYAINAILLEEENR